MCIARRPAPGRQTIPLKGVLPTQTQEQVGPAMCIAKRPAPGRQTSSAVAGRPPTQAKVKEKQVEAAVEEQA